MPLYPSKCCELGSGSKFQLLPHCCKLGPSSGSTRNLGTRHLWLAWKNDTPSTDTNLEFWNKSMHTYYNSKLNWEGVMCLQSNKEDGSGDTQT